MTPPADPDSLFSLFTELHDANVSGDYASVLKIADEIVSSYPHEILAFKAKLFALIKLGRFDEASEFMNDVPVDHIEHFALEYAYIDYRNGDYQKALELLDTADQNNLAVIELRAQVYYKMRRFYEAKQILTQILKNSTDSDDGLRRENLKIVECQAKIFVDELEDTDWILFGQKYKKKEGTRKEVEDTEIVTGKLNKRKRKRKIILPKNYDPNVAPDPERWLPKQERTAYKKKIHKKFRDKGIGRGTQGASIDPAVDKMDYSIDRPEEATQPSVTSPKPGIGPRQQGPVGKKKKQQKKK